MHIGVCLGQLGELKSNDGSTILKAYQARCDESFSGLLIFMPAS
jgi:hypothetical protein